MRPMALKLEDNPVGANPLVGLYLAINRGYSALGLTKDNSTVVSIQPSATKEIPLLTRIVIQKGDSYQDQYEFVYERFDWTLYINNPIWTAGQLPTVKALTTSKALLNAIATKTGFNFLPADFWISDNSIDYSGGTTVPNWYMEAQSDSIYWTGAKHIWLHL